MALSHFMYYSLTFHNHIAEYFASNRRPTRLMLEMLKELEGFLDDVTGSDFLMERLAELKQANRNMLGAAATLNELAFRAAEKAANRAFRRISACLQSPEDFGKPAPVMVYFGNRRYQIADGPTVMLTSSEDAVLKSFFLSAMRGPDKVLEKPELVNKSGYADAARILKRIKEKYADTLGLAIKLPGRKGLGGYCVRIERG
jgi:uncharacterized protein YqgQ